MQLDQEQQAALDAILAGKNVFLTGKAGTGKSTVIHELLRQNLPNLVCVAPTGMAACNLEHAKTIHQCFSLPLGIAYPPLQVYLEHPNADLLRAIQTVLIDEISMVRSDTFAAMDDLLRRYSVLEKRKLPFGGRQIVAVGDFYQLPPVVADQALERYLEEHFHSVFSFNTSVWTEAAFECIELTQIHRQTDLDYINFLNTLRSGGEDLAEWLEFANQRVDPNFLISDAPDTVCLCCRREDAQSINHLATELLSDPGIHLCGVISGSFPNDELPVPRNLWIRRGTRVMIQGNCRASPSNQSYKYVNGNIGTVVDYDPNGTSVRVRLNNGELVNVTPFIWSNYQYKSWRGEDGKLQIKQEEVGRFRQIPIVSAYATTIHKSQGQTLNKVHLVLGKRGCFESGQLYTALSRVRSFADLSLDRGIQMRDVLNDAMVQDFMNRLHA